MIGTPSLACLSVASAKAGRELRRRAGAGRVAPRRVAGRDSASLRVLRKHAEYRSGLGRVGLLLGELRRLRRHDLRAEERLLRQVCCPSDLLSAQVERVHLAGQIDHLAVRGNELPELAGADQVEDLVLEQRELLDDSLSQEHAAEDERPTGEHALADQAADLVERDHARGLIHSQVFRIDQPVERRQPDGEDRADRVAIPVRPFVCHGSFSVVAGRVMPPCGFQYLTYSFYLKSESGVLGEGAALVMVRARRDLGWPLTDLAGEESGVGH